MEKLAGALLDRCQYLWGIGRARKLQKHGLNLYFEVEAGSGLRDSPKLSFSTPKPPERQVLSLGRLRLCADARLPHIVQFPAQQAIDWLRNVQRHF